MMIGHLDNKGRLGEFGRMEAVWFCVVVVPSVCVYRQEGGGPEVHIVPKIPRSNLQFCAEM